MSMWVLFSTAALVFVALCAALAAVLVKKYTMQCALVSVTFLLYAMLRTFLYFWLWLERMVSCG
jgi:hypothetical protein